MEFFKGYDNTEADGTIIAIRLHNDSTLHDIVNTNLPLHFTYHFVDVYNNYTCIDTNISSLLYKIPALQFNTSIQECVDTQNIPIEHVFLDHSVLHISISSLYKLVKKTESTQLQHNNLIVLNMGSIVNAGHKNWKTDYIMHQELINKRDREIYNLLKEVNDDFGRPLPKYDEICGSSIAGCKGIDKIEIYYTQGILSQIVNTMKLLKTFIETGSYFGGVLRKNSSIKKRKNIKKSKINSNSYKNISH